MKLIIATIKPFKLEEVREALTAAGVRGMMVSEIKGFGSQSGHTEIYRGAEYAVNFVPKIKLEIVVQDSLAEQVVSAISAAAKTDKIGDGKIFVLDVESATSIYQIGKIVFMSIFNGFAAYHLMTIFKNKVVESAKGQKDVVI